MTILILFISFSIDFFGLSVNNNDSLKLDINLDKTIYELNDSITISYLLHCTSNKRLRITRSIGGIDGIWFRFKIEDEQGKVLISGKEDQFIRRTALPYLQIDTISPKAKISIQKSFNLNNIPLGTYSHLSLNPGKYKIYGVYRFEPDKEPDAAGLYKGFVEKNNLWTGICYSKPIGIVVISK